MVIPEKTSQFMTVVLDTARDMSDWKPVFFCVVIPEAQRNDPKAWIDAGKTLEEHLKESQSPLKLIHGICVSANEAAFHHYDCDQRIFSPKSEGDHFDLHSERGSLHFMAVVKSVKDMCVEQIGELLEMEQSEDEEEL